MTADGGMGDEDLIGQGRDEFIAPVGKFGGDAVGRGSERGQNQETTGGQGLFPVRRHALGQGAGGTYYYWLRATQQDLQTLFFDG